MAVTAPSDAVSQKPLNVADALTYLSEWVDYIGYSNLSFAAPIAVADYITIFQIEQGKRTIRGSTRW